MCAWGNGHRSAQITSTAQVIRSKQGGSCQSRFTTMMKIWARLWLFPGAVNFDKRSLGADLDAKGTGRVREAQFERKEEKSFVLCHKSSKRSRKVLRLIWFISKKFRVLHTCGTWKWQQISGVVINQTVKKKLNNMSKKTFRSVSYNLKRIKNTLVYPN